MVHTREHMILYELDHKLTGTTLRHEPWNMSAMFGKSSKLDPTIMAMLGTEVADTRRRRRQTLPSTNTLPNYVENATTIMTSEPRPTQS